jgi:hypothetical protein
MSRWYSLILIIAFITLAYASGGEVPFTSRGIATLPGKNICDLQGQFPAGVAVYLDYQKEHLIDYRERNGIHAAFLLGKPLSPDCGIVDAVLDLTEIRRKGEHLEFKCYTNHEGGTTWGKWGHIIGLADNEDGHKRFVKARLAWRVNIEKKRFEEIKNSVVRCDTSGYTN